MAAVAKTKQGKTETRWGAWLSESGQLSYGRNAAGEILIALDVYETLKALPLPDRTSYYRAEKETEKAKPEVPSAKQDS